MATQDRSGRKPPPGAPPQGSEARELRQIADELEQVGRVFERAELGDSGSKLIETVRGIFADYLQTVGRYPNFLDVGINVFMDVHDWTIRRHQPVRITRMAEQRFAIQFMFTQLIVRWELPNPNYVGRPYD